MRNNLLNKWLEVDEFKRNTGKVLTAVDSAAKPLLIVQCS